VALDLAARPLVPLPRKSTLFVRDPDLGWRLRPSARDLWDGVPVEVNAKGLRGPEVDYARRPGTPRLLYLGDSVAVGYGLVGHEASFPYQAAESLERALGRRVETVNGAVNGYSTWQEVAWLEREGLRYQPDLVVLAFVLNDVWADLQAARGGPVGASKPLRLSVDSGLDRLANRSALVALARQGALRFRFGRDVRAGAVREEFRSVRALVEEPGSAQVAQAWAANLANLDRLAALCRARGLRLCLVVFPFAFQLDAGEAADDPQRRLREFARERGLPALDLLPVLRARAKADGIAAADYFLDEAHPSPLGSVVVGNALSEFVIGQGLLPAPP
jgi:lysophospholipase L1-like esterase